MFQAHSSGSTNLKAKLLAITMAAVVFFASACGSTASEVDSQASSNTDTASDSSSDASTKAEKQSIVVTTSIWADVVQEVACVDEIEVIALMPPGADSHSYEPSLADRKTMDEAALLVHNGLGLEGNLISTIEAVQESGVVTFAMADHVHQDELLDGDPHAHDHDHGGEHGDEHDEDHADEHGEDHADHDREDEHGDEHDEDHADEYDEDHGGEHDEDHADEHGEDHADHDHEDEHGEEHDEDHADEHGEDHADHGHSHEEGDPHIWLDPVLIQQALPALAEQIILNTSAERTAIEACASEFGEKLDTLHHETEEKVAQVPAANRKLVTGHHSLGYFANRYGFEVIGTVIPSTSSLAATSPSELAALVETIQEYSVPAIFAESEHGTADIDAVALEGGIEVITLSTASLGDEDSDQDTYIKWFNHLTSQVVDALK